MQTVQLIDPYEDPRWDDFVETHPLGWVCHLSGWKKVLESSFKHMHGYYFALIDDSDGTIRAGLPVYHVKSRLLGDRLVSVPFATLSDPLVSTSDEFDTLFTAVEQLGKKLGVKSIKVRSFAARAHISEDKLGKAIESKLHYLKLNGDPTQLLKKFHKSCITRKIKKVAKADLVLKEVETPAELKAFHRLQNLTRKRLRLPVQPYRFFENLWEVFRPSHLVEILIAKQGDVVIGAMLNFSYKNRVSNDYLASDVKYRNLNPSHFLYWEAIKAAHAQGYEIFDFGRTALSSKSLLTFKERWATTATDLCHHYYPESEVRSYVDYDKSLKYRLIQNFCNYSPGYAYTLISKFVYSHMG